MIIDLEKWFWLGCRKYAALIVYAINSNVDNYKNYK